MTNVFGDVTSKSNLTGHAINSGPMFAEEDDVSILGAERPRVLDALEPGCPRALEDSYVTMVNARLALCPVDWVTPTRIREVGVSRVVVMCHEHHVCSDLEQVGVPVTCFCMAEARSVSVS